MFMSSGLRRHFQQLQDTLALQVVGADPAYPAGLVNFFKAFMPEGADHCSSVNGLVYSVN
jgi:hypothetical protein